MAIYTKQNLVNDLASANLGFSTKKSASAALEFIISKITSIVSKGTQVNLSGLCLFKPKTQAEKAGIVPGTGRSYISPEKRVVKIVPSATFKTQVAS